MPVLVGGKPPKKRFNIKGEWIAIGVGVPALLVMMAVAMTPEKKTDSPPQTTASSPPASSPASSSIQNATPEYKLAVVDGKPANEAQYKALLDTAEPKCIESRDDIADYSFSAGKRLRESGISVTSLDMLNGLVVATKDMSSETECRAVLSLLVTTIQAGSKQKQ